MRISDWSSDVCSSDLTTRPAEKRRAGIATKKGMAPAMSKRIASKYKINRRLGVNLWGRPKSPINKREYPPGDRKSDVEGKSVSVRLDLGGCRSLKQKNI